MPNISGLFSTYKTTIIGTIVLVVSLYLGYVFYSLKSEIESLNNTVKDLKEVISTKDVTIGRKEVKIALLEADIDKVKKVVDEQNTSLHKFKVDAEAINKRLEEYKNKPPVIKGIEKKPNATCEEIIKTLKVVKGIKYEDL